MATLKEHQSAMVDLLANGSAIPASASRLAHAMHDVLSAILSEPDLMAKAIAESKAIRDAYTTPGLNDKALSKREKALKTDSPAKWPTPAEQRVKELTNTCTQLRKQSAQYRATIASMKADRDYWYEKCLDAGLLDEERAADRKEQDEILDEWYRTEECLYDQR